MAEVTGPIRSLPGACHAVPNGTMCDDHPNVPATHRVQGETDSFGSELNDMCAACFTQHQASMAAYREEAATGCCDWCKQRATDLRDRRDWEEGSCGRVYRVCGACVRKENERLTEELGDSVEYFDGDDLSDYDGVDDERLDGDDDCLDGDDEPVEVVLPSFDATGQPPQGAKAYVEGKFVY